MRVDLAISQSLVSYLQEELRKLKEERGNVEDITKKRKNWLVAPMHRGVNYKSSLIDPLK